MKLDKPRFLLIDMSNNCEAALANHGYRVSAGTFGPVQEVTPSGTRVPVEVEADLGGFEEDEIIVVNTQRPDANSNYQRPHLNDGARAVWQSCASGIIDGRPVAMNAVREAFARIRDHGGMFVVIASNRVTESYVTAEANGNHPGRNATAFEFSNWEFLSSLDAIRTKPRRGTEITFVGGLLGDILRRGSAGAEYECEINISLVGTKYDWVALGHNKFDADVAGMLVPRVLQQRPILLLPHMPDLHTVLVELAEQWFAEQAPELFPHLTKQAWVHEAEYEIPAVLGFREKLVDMRRHAAEAVIQMEQAIKKEQEVSKSWYTLLRGTGDELVAAVIDSLHQVGFKQVIDVDAERVAERKADMREDINVSRALKNSPHARVTPGSENVPSIVESRG